MKKTETTSSIYRAMSRFLSGTMLSRLSGLGRDIAMAYAFGTSAQVAAFLVSIRFAHLLRRILGEGCLQSAFIPLFEEMKHDDPEKAAAFFKSLQKNLFLLLTFIAIIVMGLLGIYLHFAGNQEIANYTLIMMPSLIFICLYGLSASLLQCEGAFFLPSVSPVAFNGAWIIGALTLSSLPPENAMSYLSLFLIAGSFLQWAVLLPKVQKLLPKTDKKAPWSVIRRIIKPMCLGMIGIAATQINSALDSIFARFASEEGPAYLWYAIRIEQLPLALFGVALSGALLPPLTRAVKNKNMERAASFFTSAIKTSCIILIPMTFALFISGNATVSLLYQRGDFNLHSTQETVFCLWGYALGLVPSVLVLVTAPLYFANADYKTPSRASSFSVVINIILNTLGVAFFHFGAFWIAVATSFSAFFNAWMLLHFLPVEIPHKMRSHFRSICKAVFFSGLFGLLATGFESLYAKHVGEINFATQAALFSLHLTAFALTVGLFWVSELRSKAVRPLA